MHNIINYKNYADEWIEGMPFGNGMIGAMLWGEPGREIFTLNHIRLVRSKVKKDIKTSNLIKNIRELVLEGNAAGAEEIFNEAVKEYPPNINPYQVFGELKFYLPDVGNSSFYERKLDMQSGVVEISYVSEGIKYTCCSFSSKIDNVIVIKYQTDKPNALNCEITFSRPEDSECSLRTYFSNSRLITGAGFVEGVGFSSVADIDITGGTISWSNNRVVVHGTDSIVVRQALATSYEVEEPMQDCIVRLITAGRFSYKELLENHITENRRLYDRVVFSLADSCSADSSLTDSCSADSSRTYSCHADSCSADSSCTDSCHTDSCSADSSPTDSCHADSCSADSSRTDSCLDNSDTKSNTGNIYTRIFTENKIDNSVYVTLFNVARYYLMSCSRPGQGSVPMNLQGLWNDSINPMWGSGYVTDMNIQMHYWLALPANLAECHLPVFEWLKGMDSVMKRQSMNVFGCRGYYIPQYTDLFHTPACQGKHAMFQVLWSGSAAWLAQHFYEYWKFTCDVKFLFEYALPFMKQVAYFYMDFLVKNKDGKYIICPSLSPENCTAKGPWLVNSSTIDITLVNELFGNLIKIDQNQGLKDPDREKWEDIKDNIIAYPIDDNGRMKEWAEDSEEGDPYHRHISHIYGLFPGRMFLNTGKEALYDAAVKAVERRRSGGFGSCASWSHSWYACCFSRTGNGDMALSSINDLLKSGTLSNFLTTHNDWREQGLSNHMINYKLIQIDALLGSAAAIAEMLIQSYDGVIRILPALPEKWANGEVKGLCAYDGYKVDIKWKKSRIESIVITSKTAGECRLLAEKQFVRETPVLKDISGIEIMRLKGNSFEFRTEKDAVYIIDSIAK